MTFDPTLLTSAWVSAGPTVASLLVGAATVLKITKVLVLVLFVISAVLLIAVVLLQEGKGGGIAGAFGGAAAESFGVKAGTVNRFTSILASVFIGLALVHAGISSAMGESVVRTEEPKPEPAPISTPGATNVPPPAPPVVPPAMDGTPPGEPATPVTPPAPPPTVPPAPPTPPAMDETPPK